MIMAVLLWSGGADSTLVLRDLLADRIPVKTVSINHSQVICHEQHAAARERITRKLEKLTDPLDRKSKMFRPFEQTVITVTDSLGGVGHEGGLCQPLIWLGLAMLHLDNGEDLYTGYIKGDDIAWHWDDLQRAFKSLQRMRGGKGKLIAPLMWMDKVAVLKKLRGHNLLKDVWYCEDSKTHKPCGTCHSCVSHERARMWSLE